MVSVVVLCAIFLLATIYPIHMGALALAAAFVFGMWVLPGDVDARVDQIAAGFPGRPVRGADGRHVPVRYRAEQRHRRLARRRRHALGPRADVAWCRGRCSSSRRRCRRSARPGRQRSPWSRRSASALRCAIGSTRSLVGLMIVNGGSAGSFSPIGIFGSITNNVVERSGLDGEPVGPVLPLHVVQRAARRDHRRAVPRQRRRASRGGGRRG